LNIVPGTDSKPTSRSEATAPKETEHLDSGEKRALDISGDAEHADGKQKERLNEQAEELTDSGDSKGSS
jgi:hypothetical protein